MTEEEGIIFMLEETCNRVKQALVRAQEYAVVSFQPTIVIMNRVIETNLTTYSLLLNFRLPIILRLMSGTVGCG